MLAVGHISVAYLITRWFNGRFGAVSIPLIITLSVLPDVDLFIPGLTHMGPTHSVIIAVLVFGPFIFVYGKVMIPYFMAYTSHIILGDFSQYVAIDKGAMAKDMSIHVRFVYDESVFRFVYRFDGEPMLAKPITPFKGSNTQSHFVNLATRS